jgi:SAM-dependent methyltransferase
MPEHNREVFNRPDVVNEYAMHEALQPAEALAFERYVAAGVAVLDVGVGAGRTTPYLSSKASRYVGVDYSERMIEACRRKYRSLEFKCIDAREMRAFHARSFDVVVFSYNGLGYFTQESDRRNALREIHRILRKPGTFIFSLLNPRALIVWPVRSSGNFRHRAFRFFQAVWKTSRLAASRFASTALFRGAGYGRDSAHGGLDVYFAVPAAVEIEMSQEGFRILDRINGYYPKRLPQIMTPWYYYVAAKL